LKESYIEVVEVYETVKSAFCIAAIPDKLKKLLLTLTSEKSPKLAGDII
jgi:hypothetical protein